MLIKKTFPENVDYAAALIFFLIRRKQPRESMNIYYFEKMELLRSCEVTGKKTVSCVIDGISDAIVQNSARAGRYEAPEALYEKFLLPLESDRGSQLTATQKFPSSRTSKVDLRHSIQAR